MPSCGSCYYALFGKKSPSGQPWCGYGGGDQVPGGEGCHYVPKLEGSVPEGLALAKSFRVVRIDELAAENENFADAAGRLD